MDRSSAFFCFVLVLNVVLFTSAIQVFHTNRAITIDGQPRILLSGSIHYPRSTPQMWPDLIRKSKEGGLNAIETYVFWNAHEPIRRQYDFTANLDLIRFLKTIQDQGLYAVLRIGPYVCAEWNYGGFPVWLHNLPGIELRTLNSVFMNEMQNFTTLIVDMVKKENLFASQGGPVILAQIENEYGNVMTPYGEAGKAYVNWCASMADSLKVGVPWIMCQQADAPEPMINTCNGWYCDQFTPNNPNSPKMWTENWTGWFKSWGGKDPHRTSEDLAFSVARFYQLGGTFQNYYMYHGGTNFDRMAGGPYITTSYDYDAPLDEYGNLNQPKYGHLKQLHDALMSIEKPLVSGDVNTTDLGNSVSITKYTTKEGSACFFSNANVTNDATVSYNGKDFKVPAWSVSILPDCQTEVYNTAKVNTQTSVIVKKENKAEEEPAALKWLWRPENLDATARLGKGQISANMLLDQKAAANDASDYLWYMTSVYLKKADRIWSNDMTLRINGSGHVLHAFVNGEHIGSQWASYGIFTYFMERQVKLKPGKNIISLLSATVGYQNYGPFFDMVQSGIPGPVELIGRNGDETLIKDLSSHKWTYEIGLHGFENRLFSSDSRFAAKWQSENLPVNKMMTWYKTTFKAPLGTDPVALDLQGLGKGVAWVNGHNLGRYWPSFIAEEGCSLDPCDYRGAYDNKKCVSNCGHPTQRWYHVPRSFINDVDNTLVLFEEFGGNPSLVNFKTISMEKACAHAYDNHRLELSCQGRQISGIAFASYGNPLGSCGSFTTGECKSQNDALKIVENLCVGKESCAIDVSEGTFGATDCAADLVKRLAVEALC
ncbi:beta-galactosidase 15-like isoform X2 [Cucurbita pepo subsp. pepo]|uniref:beta-galactosidase 15-like isoform X2 n=1 Tax=Cucurbita pepo subsp. pepo TaxID=3664 RepID=UPI000C9D3DC1|nr:beta-galactosidase 15-like isoform X2 [Cucurbita pepo subsp. pepo]